MQSEQYRYSEGNTHNSCAVVSPSVKRAIEHTLPRTAADRNQAVFALARRVLAIPEVATVAKADVGQLRPVVVEWHRQALGVIAAEDFDECWADFVVAVERVKYPSTQPPLADIWRETLDHYPPPDVSRYRNETVKNLVNVCYRLAAHSPDGTFHLPQKEAAKALGVEQPQVCKFIKVLLADHVLELLQRGERGIAGQPGRASRYKWAGAGRIEDAHRQPEELAPAGSCAVDTDL